MRFLEKTKDGGEKSTVDAYFLFEVKSLFSIALLKFNKGSRENYHTHAFNAFTWFLSGDLEEESINYTDSKKSFLKKYKRSFIPKFTKKDNLHRVFAHRDSWCLTVRGSWDNKWTEYNRNLDETYLYTHGRVLEKVVKGLYMTDEIKSAHQLFTDCTDLRTNMSERGVVLNCFYCETKLRVDASEVENEGNPEPSEMIHCEDCTMSAIRRIAL